MLCETAQRRLGCHQLSRSYERTTNFGQEGSGPRSRFEHDFNLLPVKQPNLERRPSLLRVACESRVPKASQPAVLTGAVPRLDDSNRRLK